MRLITLTNGMTAQVDDGDAARVIAAGNWYADTSGHGERIYAYRRFADKKVYLHKYILAHTGSEDIDHIDGDGLNCQRLNLRITSRTANNLNQKKLRANNTSGVKGVYFDNYYNRWKAEIKLKGRKFSLGLFLSKEGAVEARLQAEERVNAGLPPKEAKTRGNTYRTVPLDAFSLPVKTGTTEQ